ANVAEKLRTAGAIFVGGFTPEAAGDYFAGPNHVLPTGGAARYASPLGVYHFMKRTTILEYTSREALAHHARPTERLAEVEGHPAHGRSVALRVNSCLPKSRRSSAPKSRPGRPIKSRIRHSFAPSSTQMKTPGRCRPKSPPSSPR